MSATTLILVCLLAAPLVFAAAAPEYGVARTDTALETLLGATEEPWTQAARITWGPSQYETAFRALWDDQGLYLRFDVTDPNPWHTMTRKDEHLWDEEVVEIFIDLDHSGRDYYELEINPANVVCDLRMVSPWPDKEGDIDWDFEGLETRVHARTDTTGKTTGWTAAAFLPWSGFRPLPSARDIALPPKPDDSWRVNVFRIKRPGGPDAPEKDAVFAAWSPPSVSSFHDPGAFRPFTFQAAP